MTLAIEVKNLTKKFGDNYAVKDLTFQVNKGEVVAFLGPNGAGKTTTLRLLNGVLSPSDGNGTVLGYNLLHDDILNINRKTGVVTETFTLYERLSGRYNLYFFASLYGLDNSEIKKRVKQLIDFFDLKDFIDKSVITYSSGMKKKLSIARALLHKPELLFLDEPTTSLDPKASQMIINYISRLKEKEGKTVFLCTHNLEIAEALLDKIIIIDQGQLLVSGTFEELKNKIWPYIQLEILCQEFDSKIKLEIKKKDWFLGYEKVGSSEGKIELIINIRKRKNIPDLVNKLVASGCKIFAVQEKSHSLREVYFKLRRGGEE